MNYFATTVQMCNRGILLVFVCLIATSLGSQVKAQVWSEVAPFPGTSRDDGVAFLIGTTAYFGTGLEVGWNTTVDFYAFNAPTETWTSIAPLPSGKDRQYAAAFTDQIYGYVFGGIGSNGYLNDMLRYNPTANLWEEMAPLPAPGRSGMAYFTVLGEHYIVGGRIDENTLTAETWRYLSGDDIWQQVDDYPAGSIWRAGGCNVGNLGYVGMGLNAQGSYSNAVYEYSRTTDQWSQQQSFPDVGRTHMVFSPYNGNLFALGGIDEDGTYHNDLWRYDVNSQVWEEMNALPSFGRKGGMGIGTDFGFYYTTGINADDVRLNETWKAALIVKTIDAQKSVDLHLYPNPTNDKFSIGSANGFASANVVITDLSGRIIMETKTSSDYPIEIGHLPKGMYLVQVKHLYPKAKYTTLKLVKQ